MCSVMFENEGVIKKFPSTKKLVSYSLDVVTIYSKRSDTFKSCFINLWQMIATYITLGKQK